MLSNELKSCNFPFPTWESLTTVSARFRTGALSRVKGTWWPPHYRNSWKQATPNLPVCNVQLRCVAAGSNGEAESSCHLIQEDNRYFQSDWTTYLEHQNLKAFVAQISKGAMFSAHSLMHHLHLSSNNLNQLYSVIKANYCGWEKRNAGKSHNVWQHL